MKTKLFEIRDEGTFIPVLAIKLGSEIEQEAWLLRRSGYGSERKYVLLCQIDGGAGKCGSDPLAWGWRTYPVAHNYIRQHFDDLPAGGVIDVQFILGETKEKKISEKHTEDMRAMISLTANKIEA